MPFENAQDLAPETIELFKRIVGRPNLDPTGIDEVMLGAFVCGISTPEQEEETLASLVHSREMRQRLKEMESQLAMMRATPYSKIESHLFSPVLTHCMHGAMQASMRVFCRSSRISIERGWTDISTARDLEAKAMRSVFGVMGGTIQVLLSRNHHVLGNGLVGEPRIDSSLPKGLEARVSAVIDNSGALKVEGVLTGKLPENALKDKSLYLECIDLNGGSVPIGDPITSADFSIVLENFAEIVGLRACILPPGIFRLGLRDGPGFHPGGHHLGVPVAGTNEVLHFGLVGEPTIEREQLIVTIRAPESRTPALENYSLELLVPVGSVIQCLGTWSMKEWTDNEQVFRCPISGVVDGRIECGSIIHARLH